MKIWLNRLVIFTSLFLAYYLLIDIVITDFTKNEIIRFFIIFIISFVVFILYEKKTYNIKRVYYSVRFQKFQIPNLSKIITWVSFVTLASFFTLFIGHLITAGFQRDNIGVYNRRSVDIEHSFLMAIDDFKVGIRCGNFNTTANFIKRSRNDSYLLINKRRGLGDYNDTLVSSNKYEREFERIFNSGYKAPDDWLKDVCGFYSDNWLFSK